MASSLPASSVHLAVLAKVWVYTKTAYITMQMSADSAAVLDKHRAGTGTLERRRWMSRKGYKFSFDGVTDMWLLALLWTMQYVMGTRGAAIILTA